MSKEQESEELLSDTQEPVVEGSLEFSDNNVTSTHETAKTTNLILIAKVRRSWLLQEMMAIVKLAVPVVSTTSCKCCSCMYTKLAGLSLQTWQGSGEEVIHFNSTLIPPSWPLSSS